MSRIYMGSDLLLQHCSYISEIYLGYILGISWEVFKKLLEDVFGIFWAYYWCISCTYLGRIFGKYWAYLWHILGYLTPPKVIWHLSKTIWYVPETIWHLPKVIWHQCVTNTIFRPKYKFKHIWVPKNWQKEIWIYLGQYSLADTNTIRKQV